MNNIYHKSKYFLEVFKDTKTMSPFLDPYSLNQSDETAKASKADHIHADCSLAACSYSCLQVTFQTTDVSQARYLYDQLIPMCPIMVDIFYVLLLISSDLVKEK